MLTLVGPSRSPCGSSRSPTIGRLSRDAPNTRAIDRGGRHGQERKPGANERREPASPGPAQGGGRRSDRQPPAGQAGPRRSSPRPAARALGAPQGRSAPVGPGGSRPRRDRGQPSAIVSPLPCRIESRPTVRRNPIPAPPSITRDRMHVLEPRARRHAKSTSHKRSPDWSGSRQKPGRRDSWRPCRFGLCWPIMSRLGSADVAIPDFQTLMRPILVQLRDGQPRAIAGCQRVRPY
jgi:hypothetical protein